MSVQFRITDQILRVDDASDATEGLVHKYDAFLNLLHTGNYAFLRDAARTAIRFLISPKYPDLERLARENWQNNQTLAARHDNSIDAFLAKMPLRDRKAATLDIATGGGKSFLMYGIAAIALAEGLVDRVLVLCPSLTIEDGLLEKFNRLAGDPRLAEVMKELGALISIPGIKRGNETIQPGDICIENIHAVYGNAGSSISDSFRGNGERTLVLNDEAHHLFSPDDSDESSMKKWLLFLKGAGYDFRYMLHVTGTAYVGNDYFPDVIYRFGLKQAVEAKVVKKPDYVQEETYKKQSWDKIHTVHMGNVKEYGTKVRPISIVVTKDIAECVEQWKQLVDFLVKKEKISRADAEQKAIWVTSGIPTAKAAKARVEAAYCPRDSKDSPDKRRKENIAALKGVDDPSSPVEWIVSVSMLTEGWDVKNVFQVVPHDSRAFGSKLLIAQVLGRGLRVPPNLDTRPLLKVTNHEAWSAEIANLLRDVLEVENTLSWGYDSRRDEYVFPLHNLSYELVDKTVETKKQKATEIILTLKPQSRKSTEYSTFSESGKLAIELLHEDVHEIEYAVCMLHDFIADKDRKLGEKWPKSRIRKLITGALRSGGYDDTFLSRENLSLVQQAFGPLFRDVDREHPRKANVAKALMTIDYRESMRQSFSEGRIKENGAVYHVDGDTKPFDKDEAYLWKQYCKWAEMVEAFGDETPENIKEIVKRLHQVDAAKFKTPVNVLYASHEPERRFSDLLFERSDLIGSFIKSPDRGCYSFPYSYKPAKTGKTHARNEFFNPDFFIRLKACHDVLVVEIKQDGDDNNRNRAKFRDGKAHFERLNAALTEAGEPWRYHFYFLSPQDYTGFFDKIADGGYEGWKSSLMQDLSSLT
ncbi:DEAD/DEAH box helicase [Geobacter sp. DSM 9736]|uniref:DEAD/DEAH box helicase n=1 Tax=Geobacter sp. DSM 9736 TaxID=1277350 RepID=UPI000B50198A|nr:DEAD/DEAH box helicase family protein [Geobacter sp. DSM 9736]SNB46498.1 type III restriction enzyme [Geobacter sp. DSM 9736]